MSSRALPTAAPHAVAAAAKSAAAALRGPGRRIAAAHRETAEASLGHDFGDVRIHTDDEAARALGPLGVRACALGRDIAFAPGEWRPGTAAGDSLLAHELAHTAQQATSQPGSALRLSSPADERDADAAAAAIGAGRSYRTLTGGPAALAAKDGPTGTEIPKLDAENPYGPPSDEAVKEVESAKKALLGALEKYDSSTFLYVLRGLSSSVRLSLEGDKAFLAEARKHLWGKSYWILQRKLRFGANDPPYVRQLSLAMLDKDVRMIADLLRGFPDLTRPSVVPGVYDVLAHEFKGHPWRATLLRLAREPESARVKQDYKYDEVHYEKPKGGGAYALKKYGGTATYDLARTANELRIVVRIRLVEKTNTSKTYWPSDAKRKGWRERIQSAWNGRFAANNGTNRLRIVFVALFTETSPHFTVTVDRSKDYVRANETNWWSESSPSTVAHEFGHMVGNPDEYRLPGRMSDIPKSMGVSTADRKRSSVEGVKGKPPASPSTSGTSLEGTMGEPHKEGSHAERRHVWPILDRYNRTVKPPHENDYLLVAD